MCIRIKSLTLLDGGTMRARVHFAMHNNFALPIRFERVFCSFLLQRALQHHNITQYVRRVHVNLMTCEQLTRMIAESVAALFINTYISLFLAAVRCVLPHVVAPHAAMTGPIYEWNYTRVARACSRSPRKTQAPHILCALRWRLSTSIYTIL